MKIKRLNIIFGTVAALLLIPFIAMQFTDEISWKAGDFLVMGLLLSGLGFLYEFVLRKVSRPEYRITLILIAVAAFLLIWAELAVGIFGTPFAGS